jgi:hypothetical protein
MVGFPEHSEISCSAVGTYGIIDLISMTLLFESFCGVENWAISLSDYPQLCVSDATATLA